MDVNSPATGPMGSRKREAAARHGERKATAPTRGAGCCLYETLPPEPVFTEAHPPNAELELAARTAMQLADTYRVDRLTQEVAPLAALVANVHGGQHGPDLAGRSPHVS